MRFDSIGMFWADMPTSRKRGDIVRPRPEVPHTGWTYPREFPNLSRATVISLDTETWEPEFDLGPGWARGKGHIVGFSLAAKDPTGELGKWYWPLRHEDTPEENYPDTDQAMRWLKAQLEDNRPKVGANITYDIGWLNQEGIFPKGKFYDVQFAEALLHEIGNVDLDTLAMKYLHLHKETSLLYQWCADFYGGNATGKQRANIYRAPPSLVGPYGEADAILPIQILEHQWPLLYQQDLMEVFDMECGLIPLMIKMRFAGVSVDIPKAEEAKARLEAETVVLKERLRQEVGFIPNVDAADDLAKAFDKAGISYGRTKPSTNFPQGRPSFTKKFLQSVSHPIADIIRDIRAHQKLTGTFIQSYILDNHVNGKVYGSFNQLRGDGSGARSGRLSSSNPNLQNIPIRSELGKVIREIFVVDYGHEMWRKYDYSQIEYRFLAHFASDSGDGSADRLRASYCENPDIDYHKHVHGLILRMSGVDLERSYVKNMNFGLVYGMGEPKLRSDLGITEEQGRQLFDAYHTGAPFVKPTMRNVSNYAGQTGIITTVMGRRSRFDMWEPRRGGAPALTYGLARATYGNDLRRAYTHKALNRRLQGSAADLMKKAMLDCWEGGVFDETGVPRLTVHDELDFSDPGGKDAAFREVEHIMENCIKLRVPIRVALDKGINWGKVK